MQDYGETVSARARLRRVAGSDERKQSCRWFKPCSIFAFGIAMLLTGGLFLWDVLREGTSQAAVVPAAQNNISPTIAPSKSVAAAPTATRPFCALEKFACPRNGRFGQAPAYELRVGKAICKFPYIFGWSLTDPVLQWKNCDTNETRVVWDGRPYQYDPIELSFRLWPNATLTIHDTEKLVWFKQSLRQTERAICLPSPAMDCPFLQMDPNGDLVMKYIASDRNFTIRQVHDVYFDLYPKAETTMTDVKNVHLCAQIMPNLVCLGEYLGHGSQFQLGSDKAICNREYMLGWTRSGVLELRNCLTNVSKVVYDVGPNNPQSGDSYFMLNDDASIEISSGSTQLWRQNCESCQSRSRACLDDPLLSCPFFHLRKSGDLVLNYADNNNVTAPWTQRNANRPYNELFSLL